MINVLPNVWSLELNVPELSKSQQFLKTKFNQQCLTCLIQFVDYHPIPRFHENGNAHKLGPQVTAQQQQRSTLQRKYNRHSCNS